MSGAAVRLPFESGLRPPQRAQVEHLWRDGFVRIRGLLSGEDVTTLQSACARLMREQPRAPWSEAGRYGRQYRVPVYVDKDWSVLGNIAGLSAEADRVLERVFTHAELIPVLQVVLGTGYKICQLGIRRSEGADDGLRMHQDAKGEFGMSVLLADIPDNGGTTAFLPGSHRYPLRSVEAGMPYIHPKYLRRWARSASGKAGDVFLFFNKTWHGRLPTSQAVPHDAILLSFFGAGYEFQPSDVPAELLQSLPPELRRLLDPADGMTRLADGSGRVSGRERQPSCLIDEVYEKPSSPLHPSQLLRLMVPVFRAALPIRRWARRRT